MGEYTDDKNEENIETIGEGYQRALDVANNGLDILNDLQKENIATPEESEKKEELNTNRDDSVDKKNANTDSDNEKSMNNDDSSNTSAIAPKVHVNEDSDNNDLNSLKNEDLYNSDEAHPDAGNKELPNHLSGDNSGSDKLKKNISADKSVPKESANNASNEKSNNDEKKGNRKKDNEGSKNGSDKQFNNLSAGNKSSKEDSTSSGNNRSTHTDSAVKEKIDKSKETAKKSKRQFIKSKLAKVMAMIVVNPITWILFVILIFLLVVVIVTVSSLSSITSQSSDPISLEGLPPFITEEMVTAFIEMRDEYGDPPSVGLAQVITESGFGRNGPGGENGQGLSGLAYNNKNLFGMKGRNCEHRNGIVTYTTGEYGANGSYTTSASFNTYASYTDCIKCRSSDHWLGRYKSKDFRIKGTGWTVEQANEFAKAIAGEYGSPAWATDPSYSSKLINQMERYDLYRFDTISIDDVDDILNGSSEVGYNNVPRYYQNDYANVSYGSSNIARCGCGPSSFAMVASALTGQTITPADAVAWCGNRYYVGGQGTSWGYFAAAASHFGLNTTVRQVGGSQAYTALSRGKLVISSQSPGLFTNGGHYIVLTGLDSNGKVYVNDPNKNNAVNKGYNNRTFDFASEINVTAKMYFVFE